MLLQNQYEFLSSVKHKWRRIVMMFFLLKKRLNVAQAQYSKLYVTTRSSNIYSFIILPNQVQRT